MTNKFLLYDLHAGGFLSADGNVQDNDMEKGALFSKTSAEKTVFPMDENDYLMFPMTQGFIDALPFELEDTAPGTPHSQTQNVSQALKGDFVVLNEEGFFDEKYNSLTNWSHPNITGYVLDYANLYNMAQLEKFGTTEILENAIVIPVSKEQQAALMENPKFSPSEHPHGFFMEPIGYPDENARMPDLGEALDVLETEASRQEAPIALS